MYVPPAAECMGRCSTKCMGRAPWNVLLEYSCSAGTSTGTAVPTMLADQITDIYALHPGDPIAAYVSLKKLIMKTYTRVDAPKQARSSLLAVRMNAVLGPQSLQNLLSSAKKTCDLYPGCDGARTQVVPCRSYERISRSSRAVNLDVVRVEDHRTVCCMRRQQHTVRAHELSSIVIA